MPPRKKTDAVPAPLSSEVVPEGDFAGMTYDEVMRACVSDVHDALGGLSVVGALATLDCVLSEALEIVRYTEGDAAAKEAGLKICQTALPYAMLDASADARSKSLAEARKAFLDREGR